MLPIDDLREAAFRGLRSRLDCPDVKKSPSKPVVDRQIDWS